MSRVVKITKQAYIYRSSSQIYGTAEANFKEEGYVISSVAKGHASSPVANHMDEGIVMARVAKLP
jgi:hypothetical protein